jgi:hypothetical protein
LFSCLVKVIVGEEERLRAMSSPVDVLPKWFPIIEE